MVKAEERASDDKQKPGGKESPAEKLQDVKPAGSVAPGAENPDSEGIKGETNPNTE